MSEQGYLPPPPDWAGHPQTVRLAEELSQDAAAAFEAWQSASQASTDPAVRAAWMRWNVLMITTHTVVRGFPEPEQQQGEDTDE